MGLLQKDCSMSLEELVFLQNNQAICTSMEVAKRFNKKHKTVLRNIDNIVAQNCATKQMFYKMGVFLTLMQIKYIEKFIKPLDFWTP